MNTEIKQEDITINAFNFNNYLENNPIAQACVESWKKMMPKAKIKIWSLEELLDIIKLYNFSNLAYENNLGSYIGDPVRIHLATINKNFLYMDLDTFLTNDLTPLCAEYDNFCVSYDYYNEEKEYRSAFINNGALFWSTNYGEGFWKYIQKEYKKLDKTITKIEDVYKNDICTWTKKIFADKPELAKPYVKYLNCRWFNSNFTEDTLFDKYICHVGISCFLFRSDNEKNKNYNNEIYYTEFPNEEFKKDFALNKLKSYKNKIKNLFLISDKLGYIDMSKQPSKVELRHVIFPQQMSTFEKRDLFKKQIKKLYNKEPIYIPAEAYLESYPNICFHIPKNIKYQKEFLLSKYKTSRVVVEKNDIDKLDIKIKNDRRSYYDTYTLLDNAEIDIFIPSNIVIYDDIHTVVNEFFKEQGIVRTFDISNLVPIKNTTFNIVCCKKDIEQSLINVKILLYTGNKVNVYYNEDECTDKFIDFLEDENFNFNYGKTSVYGARKKMLNSVKTDYCLYIDPDDYFFPTQNINTYIDTKNDLIVLNYIDQIYSIATSTKYKMLCWSGLWNKLTKTEELKKAYSYIKDLPQLYEDKIIYLILAYNCRNSTYYALDEQPNYIYKISSWKEENRMCFLKQKKEELFFTFNEIKNIKTEKIKDFLMFELTTTLLDDVAKVFKEDNDKYFNNKTIGKTIEIEKKVEKKVKKTNTKKEEEINKMLIKLSNLESTPFIEQFKNKLQKQVEEMQNEVIIEKEEVLDLSPVNDDATFFSIELIDFLSKYFSMNDIMMNLAAHFLRFNNTLIYQIMYEHYYDAISECYLKLPERYCCDFLTTQFKRRYVENFGFDIF